MIVYEVNLKISSEIYKAYMEWLMPHVQEMLEFNGFEKAKFLKETNFDDPNFEHVTMQYQVDNMDNLNNYLENYSKKMRGDGLTRFPDGFTATRRFFELKEEIFPLTKNR